MLNESKEEMNNLDKLHRERTRWVTATWVFGVLFVLAAIAVFGLGFYLVKPGLLKNVGLEQKEQAQPSKDAPSALDETAPSPQVAGVSVDDDPVQGSPDAPVTMIEFSDFLCPYCAVSAGFRPDLTAQMKSRDAAWEAAVPKILETYVKEGKVRFVFRDCPFHGEGALSAAQAADCGRDQGKYWEMHDLLFQSQDQLPEKEEDLPVFLKGLADKLGLSQNQFDECLDSGKYKEEVNKDLEAAKAAGVTGTPTYFINGQKIVGAQPFSAFQEIIEAELKKQ